MLEYPSGNVCGRLIDLESAKSVGQRGRHARISKKARTVVRVNQTRITQGRAKKEKKLMTKEEVCVGVDVAKNTLDVAFSSSEGIRQFTNDHEGITNAGQYITGLKPDRIIIEATGRLEIPLEVSENLRW